MQNDKNPLDAIASQAGAELSSAPGAQGPGESAAPGQSGEAQNAQMAQIEANVVKVILGVLKAARALIARKMPEIKSEWTDEVLNAPAAAAVPLLNRYMQRFMEMAGSNPELAIFAFSLIPLVMGYIDAMDKHAGNTIDADHPATGAPAGGPAES